MFHKNIHLAPNVTEVLNDIANTTDSRATIKRIAQNDRFKKAGDKNHQVLVKIKKVTRITRFLSRSRTSLVEAAVHCLFKIIVTGRQVSHVPRSIMLGRRFR